MRLSQLIGKDIINLQNGGRLGMACDCDLIVREDSGIIESITLPGRGGFFGFRDRDYLTVPWSAVKKIGSEVIIMDLDETLG